MNKGLEALKELINELLGHTALLTDDDVKTKETIIEKELKERSYLCHLVDSLFDECEVGISAEYDEDLRKYDIEFQIDGKYKFHIYCDRKEYLFWRKLSGVDDQYGPEDLK